MSGIIQNSEFMSREKIQKSEYKYSELGYRISMLEESKNLNQFQLSELLDISSSYLSEIKYGRVKKGGLKFWDAIRQNFPEWESYLRGITDKPPIDDACQQSEEHMVPFDKGREISDTRLVHLNEVEYDLIKALREMNSINRIGLYSTAINLINDEAREREIKKNKRKKEIFSKATKTLAKAIHES